VQAFLEGGLVICDQVREYFDAIEPERLRDPALDPTEVRSRVLRIVAAPARDRRGS
jgi:hypothetical protein